MWNAVSEVDGQLSIVMQQPLAESLLNCSATIYRHIK